MGADRAGSRGRGLCPGLDHRAGNRLQLSVTRRVRQRVGELSPIPPVPRRLAGVSDSRYRRDRPDHFAAAVYTILRGGGALGALPAVAFGGAIAAASVSLTQATVGQVLASKAAPTGDASLVTSLVGLDIQADTYKLLGLILLVVCASVALAGIRAVPRWVMWGGIVVGVLLLLGSWSSPVNFAPLGLALDLSLLGLLAWVGVVAFFLMRSKSLMGGA